MDKAVLETALRRMAREQGVERVITTEMEPALTKGENYASDIQRVQARVVLGNGRVANRTFILKRVLQNQMEANFFKEYQVFRTETKIYTLVLRQMEYLMEEFGDTQGPLWCNLIHYEPYTSLLLEDLKSSGYTVVKREAGMDLDHALLAIRALGRFHGLAKILEVRGITSKNNFKPYGGNDEKVLRTLTYPAAQNMVRAIKQHWGPEWSSIAEKLNIPFEEFVQIVNKSLTSEESEFKVQNHGDCWSNNIMFRYDWQMRPISVRFLDFQWPHYSTPCMDLSNFMFFSVQSVVRRENYHCLLENYYESLMNTFSKYNYEGSKPNIEEIFNVMKRLSFFWTYVFLCWYPMLTADPTETFDLEKLLQTEGGDGFNTEAFKRERIKEALVPDIINLTQKLTTSSLVSS